MNVSAVSYGPVSYGQVKTPEAIVPGAVSSVANRSMFSNGLMTMQSIMLQLTQNGNDLFAQMNAKSSEARDAQEQANFFESLIATLDKPKDKAWIPHENWAFMVDKKIMVDGKSFREFMEDKNFHLDKAGLMSVKSALESVSGRASDFNQQNQLKLQQIMQNYSTSSQLTQSVQSMLAEMTKGTAAAIR
jgi:secreted effector protein SseB